MDDKTLEKLLRGMDEDVKVPKNLAAKISKHVEKNAGGPNTGLDGVETASKPFWSNFNMPLVFTGVVASFAVVLMIASYMPGDSLRVAETGDLLTVDGPKSFEALDEETGEVLQVVVEPSGDKHFVSSAEVEEEGVTADEDVSGGPQDKGVIVDIQPVPGKPGWSEVTILFSNGGTKIVRVPNDELPGDKGSYVGDDITIMDGTDVENSSAGGRPDVQTN
jgi:hypothetical protein